MGNATRHTAVVVPYRNRPDQLLIFIDYIHFFLQRKHNIHYTIYVVNQTDSHKFNRAMLMNIGFLEAMADFKWSCVVFHESDSNKYSCGDQPLHMSSHIDKFNYKLPYPTIFGGVTALRPDIFRKVNGYSNMFWGWGGEDDDMYNRVAFHGLQVTRLGDPQGRYKMIRHKEEVKGAQRVELVQSGQKR